MHQQQTCQFFKTIFIYLKKKRKMQNALRTWTKNTHYSFDFLDLWDINVHIHKHLKKWKRIKKKTKMFTTILKDYVL